MKAKLRSVNTKFWEDPFVEGLKPDEKLLFLYLLTNPMANMLGIYEISVKRISYDTGINQDRVKKILKSFESVGKVLRESDYVIMPNWLKNQSLNSNMQTGAINIYNDLPKWLRDRINEKSLKAFESLRNAMLNMKGNMNIESEVEDEVEKKEVIGIEFDIFWNLYDKKVGDKLKIWKKWKKLKDWERKEIIEKLPAYIQSTPNKKFRRNPETYLNQRGWEDEIIKQQTEIHKDSSYD